MTAALHAEGEGRAAAAPGVSPPSAFPVGLRDGLSYGALALPLAFLALPLTIALPHHYASHHGLSLAALGALLLAVRLVDTALDPWIGQWVDRGLAGSRRRLRAVALGAACALAAGFAALFLAPAALVARAPWAWLAAHLVVVYVAYSALSVLHQAWGTRLGGDARQRSRVVAWREGCGLVGVLLAGVLPAAAGFGVTAAALAMLLTAALPLLFRTSLALPASASASTSASTSTSTSASASISPSSSSMTATACVRAGAAWWRPLSDAPFRALLALYMLNGIGNAIAATLVSFFVDDRLGASASMPAFLGGYFLAAVLALPAWLRVIGRFGAASAWACGMALSVLAFGMALPLGAGDADAFLLICLASGAALGADLAVPAALLTALLQQGGRLAEAGVFAGWWTAATKLNLGLAAGLALPLLAGAGYVPGHRDDAALQALSLAYVLGPCVLKLLAIAGLLAWRRRQPEDLSCTRS